MKVGELDLGAGAVAIGVEIERAGEVVVDDPVVGILRRGAVRNAPAASAPGARPVKIASSSWNLPCPGEKSTIWSMLPPPSAVVNAKGIEAAIP